jgi:hypothetical protein
MKEFKVICIKGFDDKNISYPNVVKRLTEGKIYIAKESSVHIDTHYIILGDDINSRPYFNKYHFEILRDHNIDNIL